MEKDKKRAVKSAYLCGRRIFPANITGRESLEDIVDDAFLAFNSARLAEGCRLFAEKMLADNVTVGMGLAGALTPAGLGRSCIAPLINAGFADWIVSTGANLYHDLHFAFNKPLYSGRNFADDVRLRKDEVVRIYDILLSYRGCLAATDRILNKILKEPLLQTTMGTAQLHYLLGRYCSDAEEKLGVKNSSILAAAYRQKVPIYTSSPGDSAIGMAVAGLALNGGGLKIDPSIDVNETAAIVFNARRNKGKSAVFLIGGGSPKNFILQTEPHIQDILKVAESGHDYFLQITDARADTGGLSGATPSEAVSWKKVNPDMLPDAVVCYSDVTIALPLLTHYALSSRKRRPLKRLYDLRGSQYDALVREYLAGKNNSRQR